MDIKQVQTLSRARPIRIAYLVPYAEDSHDILSAIFAAAFEHWGGRFSLIVPCTDGVPLPTYRPWLEAFDADIIYSYLDLSPGERENIHETLYPASLLRHPNYRADRPNFAPVLPTLPLTALTIIPVAGPSGLLDGRRGVRILGAMGSMDQTRFLSDSFGFVSPQIRNAIRGPLADFGSVVVAIASGELEPTTRYLSDAEETLQDVNSILTAMASDKRFIGVSKLSSIQSSRLDLQSSPWADAFNIVIGDTVADRILYWNARALSSGFNDAHDADLCIPVAQLEEPGFLDALCDFLNARNYISAGGGGGPYRATLRSISLDNDRLAQIAKDFNATRPWVKFSYEHVAGLEDVAPTELVLGNASFIAGDSIFRVGNSWKESYSTGDQIRLTSPEPIHLRHLPPALQSDEVGAWAVDLDIERTADHSPYDNVKHRWRLPRRLRTARSFISPYRLRQHGPVVEPRVSRGGLLTAFTVPTGPMPPISTPSDETAIVHALTQGRDWGGFGPSDPREPLRQLCAEAGPSSAGRQFWGVYQLFGGINAARGVLQHEFWQTQFERVGATGVRAEARHDQVQTRLRRRLNARVLDLSQTDNLQELSNLVLQEADDVRAPTRLLTWTQLEADFEALVSRYEADNPDPDPNTAAIEEERSWQRKGLVEAVQGLCQRGILHQGYEHRCRKCLHRSWIGIGALTSMIACEVCGDAQPAPVSKPWQFRVNGFLRDGLQRHGIGPLFWVLSRYQSRARGSFWFEGPLDVYFNQSELPARRPDTDIDLTMIDQGRVRMCEVKQSDRQFLKPAEMATNFARLRPDVAMIAVMEPISPSIQQKFDVFAKTLAGTGVEPELMTLDENLDIDRSPYFASQMSRLVVF